LNSTKIDNLMWSKADVRTGAKFIEHIHDRKTEAESQVYSHAPRSGLGDPW
jgi:hypothetical protein